MAAERGNIVRLGHVEYRVTDLARARDFYVDLLGLIETARERDRIYLRCIEDREHHRLVLRQAERSASHETQRRGAEDRLAPHHAGVRAGLPRGADRRPHTGPSLPGDRRWPWRGVRRRADAPSGAGARTTVEQLLRPRPEAIRRDRPGLPGAALRHRADRGPRAFRPRPDGPGAPGKGRFDVAFLQPAPAG